MDSTYNPQDKFRQELQYYYAFSQLQRRTGNESATPREEIACNLAYTQQKFDKDEEIHEENAKPENQGKTERIDDEKEFTEKKEQKC